MKLFISYRSLDSAKVDSIAAKLKAIEDENGQRIYSVWQDKHNIPDGHNWWEAIVDAIIDCDIFIFMVSKESCTSPICQAEVRYAFLRNRPIIPIVLEGEYFYNPQTAKNDLRFWDVIPDELNRRNAQFLFYEGGSFAQRMENAIQVFQDEAYRWKDKQAKRPIDPRNKDDVFDVYKVAVECAYRKELETAEQLFLRLMNSADDTFHHEADKWVDIVRAYHDIKKFASHKSTEHRLAKAWTKYQETYFPVEFIDGVFDPFDIAAKIRLAAVKADQKPIAPLSERVSPQLQVANDEFDDWLSALDLTQPQSQQAKQKSPLPSSRSQLFDILPMPFDLIKIPQGSVTIEGKTEIIATFGIAKYPITNAQFARFIAANGYENKVWWTSSGWEACLQGWYYDNNDEDWKPSGKPWSEPRFWHDTKWNSATQPVVGISWYEAVAFCLWLNYETNNEIMLPTEQQWQRAAQGDDGRTYPWGNDWDSSRCNNNVDGNGIGKTTPVTQYEGKNKNDSYFGVVDMVGNVWEWCRTVYATGSQDINGTDIRVLRGGSWNSSRSDSLRVDYSVRNAPYVIGNFGFRIALTPNL